MTTSDGAPTPIEPTPVDLRLASAVRTSVPAVAATLVAGILGSPVLLLAWSGPGSGYFLSMIVSGFLIRLGVWAALLIGLRTRTAAPRSVAWSAAVALLASVIGSAIGIVASGFNPFSLFYELLPAMAFLLCTLIGVATVADLTSRDSTTRARIFTTVTAAALALGGALIPVLWLQYQTVSGGGWSPNPLPTPEEIARYYWMAGFAFGLPLVAVAIAAIRRRLAMLMTAVIILLLALWAVLVLSVPAANWEIATALG